MRASWVLLQVAVSAEVPSFQDIEATQAEDAVDAPVEEQGVLSAVCSLITH